MILSKQQVFGISNREEFDLAALQIFRHQVENGSVYKEFIAGMRIDIEKVNHVEQIPFLPVEFFKSHTIVSNSDAADVIFSSSGTTGIITSRHVVTDVSWYQESFCSAFELFYGDIEKYTILALLPSYLEREGSSLIYMAEDLIKQSNNPDSGFYLYNYSELYHQLKKQQQNKKPTLLIGVTFALLDFVEQYRIDFPELIVMETGGMKGRRKEMLKEELHATLKEKLNIHTVYSEYGMTELLSQGYSLQNGLFQTPPWMRILIRDTNDPFTYLSPNKMGGINVIDLANINSCSFIATQDLGKLHPDNYFELMGRFDNSDIRGCNLLVE